MYLVRRRLRPLSPTGQRMGCRLHSHHQAARTTGSGSRRGQPAELVGDFHRIAAREHGDELAIGTLCGEPRSRRGWSRQRLQSGDSAPSRSVWSVTKFGLVNRARKINENPSSHQSPSRCCRSAGKRSKRGQAAGSSESPRKRFHLFSANAGSGYRRYGPALRDKPGETGTPSQQSGS